MAVIRISEADAARDFGVVIGYAREGDEVHIEASDRSYVLLRQAEPAGHSGEPVLLSTAIAALEQLRSTARLDAGFADDVLDGIRSHQHETLGNPWGLQVLNF